jgi:hypothetical protein
VARAIIVRPIVLLWGIRVLLRGGYDHVTGGTIIIRERVKIGTWGIVGGCERMEGMWRVIVDVMVGEMRGVRGNHQRGKG